jgi:hypothetical protein
MLLAEEERRLFVADEESGSVAVFDIGEDGRLTASVLPIPVPGAAFLFET